MEIGPDAMMADESRLRCGRDGMRTTRMDENECFFFQSTLDRKWKFIDMRGSNGSIPCDESH